MENEKIEDWKPNRKVYYLAHPYTYIKEIGVTEEENVKKCIYCCNELLDRGYVVFAPIVHSHFIHEIVKRTDEFWYLQDLDILEGMDGAIFCGDWYLSKGCCIEMSYCVKNKKEILYYKDLVKE